MNLGFRVSDLGSIGFKGLGMRVSGLGFRVSGLGFRVWGLGFGLWELGVLGRWHAVRAFALQGWQVSSGSCFVRVR